MVSFISIFICLDVFLISSLTYWLISFCKWKFYWNMFTLIWLCIIRTCFHAITQDYVGVSETSRRKTSKYLIYSMTSCRKVYWPQYWRIKCLCELTQIIVVPYYFKNTNLYLDLSMHILVDMSNYIDIYVFILDCTVPNWVYHIIKLMFKSATENFTWLCSYEILIFVILNFIPFFWICLFHLIKLEVQSWKCNQSNFLSHQFQIILLRIMVKFLGYLITLGSLFCPLPKAASVR